MLLSHPACAKAHSYGPYLETIVLAVADEGTRYSDDVCLTLCHNGERDNWDTSCLKDPSVANQEDTFAYKMRMVNDVAVLQSE